MFRSYRAVVMLCCGALCCERVLAASEQQAGPYCGIYCLYAASRWLDKPIPFERLLNPRYIGSMEGSSLPELQQAALENGLNALVIKDLSGRDVRKSKFPLILYVKSNPAAFGYNH